MFDLNTLVELLNLNDRVASKEKFNKIVAGRAAFTPSHAAGFLDPAEWVLVIKIPNYEDVLKPLENGVWLIGRIPGSTLNLTNTMISKFHCLLDMQHDGHATIQDLESANGTWLGSQKLAPYKVYEIIPGEEIILPDATILMISKKPG
ncbi:MAG TPA: FHA domain-containing protein [Candidatus Andersenbacteria bacterium]|nr:FHA domain-containing protein [Candidatus Andersenbacteria bacterium]